MAREAAAVASSRRFFFWMAVVFTLIAFGGFTPSYWSRLSSASFHLPPITHIHGALLFTWVLFYLGQTGWVAAGKIARHRAWGLAGISLFTLLVCSILITTITRMRIDDANGFGEASRRFAAITLFNLPVMIAFFAAAIANISRPEIHKRLMYSLMVGMMIPAIARVFIALFAPAGGIHGAPPPPFVALPPTFVALLLIVVAVIYDRRTLGRWSAIYLYSGATLLVWNIGAVLLAPTRPWLAIASYLERLGG